MHVGVCRIFREREGNQECVREEKTQRMCLCVWESKKERQFSFSSLFPVAGVKFAATFLNMLLTLTRSQRMQKGHGFSNYLQISNIRPPSVPFPSEFLIFETEEAMVMHFRSNWRLWERYITSSNVSKTRQFEFERQDVIQADYFDTSNYQPIVAKPESRSQ